MQNQNHSSLENSLSNYNPSDESNQYNLYEQQTYGSQSIYDGQTFSNQSDESCELSVEHQQSFPEQSHNVLMFQFFQFNTNHSQGAAQNGSLGIVSDFKQQVHYPPPPQSTSFFMPYHNNQKQSHTSECLNEELEVHPIKPDLQEQAMEHEIQSENDKSDSNNGKEICSDQMIQNQAHSTQTNIQENDKKMNTEANRFMNLEANRFMNMEANSQYSRNIVVQHKERTIIGSFVNSSSTNNDLERKKENLKNQEKQTVRAKAHLHEDQIRKMRKPLTKKNESSEEL